GKPGARIGERQLHLLSGSYRPGKHHGEDVVASACQLRALQRLVLNKLNRLSIDFHLADLEEPRQLEQQRPGASPKHLYLQGSVGMKSGGRVYLRANSIAPDRNLIRLLLFG